MKIKTSNIEFVSFSDGVCDIYSEDEEGNKIYKYSSLGFTNRILGYRRYFTAAANQVKTDRVIKIPQVTGIDIHDTVEIKGMGKYDIELVQPIYETNPRSTDLTLRHLQMHEVTP